MDWKTFEKWNNITGWLVFAIATVVYALTIEPTTSFWDCGEYISTAYKLQVGHPPGAPFFQIMGAVFAFFSFGDVTQVAKMVNLMSALSSSFTILFLFWTITAFGRKILTAKNEELNAGSLLAVLGAGAVGGLAYTFSDSFWFSAVEGEVYAMSSFFTALAFWLILKWERVADQPGADRWIVLIAYMMGLSIGVHMLALLVIPPIVMLYYYKKHKTDRKGFVLANVVGVIILAFVFKVLFPFILSYSSKFEIFFANSLGMPFNVGTIVFGIILIAAIFFGLRYTKKKGYILLNTGIVCVIFMIIGYSSFTTLVIRSNANTPIDENNPEDAVGLLAYLNREQYGDFPLLYGWYYNSPLDRRQPFKDGNARFEKDEASGKYIMIDNGKDAIPNYDSEYQSIFPRMWDRNDPSHADTYKEWGKVKTPDDKRPSFSENFRFFWSYQLNYMYWRYFMWNFAGRQNDEQGRGGLSEGNWISGINFIDESRIGPQDNLPAPRADNKGRNKYYLLPLALGLIGLLYHYKKHPKDAYVNTLLFLMTGIAIVVYVNQYAYQPRERDYAYVGSFYAFAVWIGLGAMAIWDFMRKKTASKVAAVLTTVLCLALVPGIMAKENWDDHDRSNRYTALDFAKNYLSSCAPNAILFTNGDNDTFPLWYVQEVEGYRTDVRVVNLSLLNTDWYIDQLKRAAYDSPPVPFSLEKPQYRQGTRDVVYYQEKGNSAQRRWDVGEMMKWIASDDKSTKVSGGGREFDFYPTKKLRIPVDREKVMANGTVSPKDSARVQDYLDWDLSNNSLYKRDVMIIDLLANNNWERPIYFAITVGNSPSAFLNLNDYFQLEGMAFRLVPFRTNSMDRQLGEVNSAIAYDNMMNKFVWGNMQDPDIYLDETNRRMAMNFRNNFARLADQLREEGDIESAVKALDYAIEIMPDNVITFDYFNLPIAIAYYRCGEIEKGDAVIRTLARHQVDELVYFSQFKGNFQKAVQNELGRASQFFQTCNQYATQFGSPELQQELEDMMKNVLSGL